MKEFRLRGISNMDDGNAFLPEFIADYNRRFARAPQSAHDARSKTSNPLRDADPIGSFCNEIESELEHPIFWFELGYSAFLCIEAPRVGCLVAAFSWLYSMRRSLSETVSVSNKRG